jgi:SNF2 family DNA or RNA helicase
MLDQDNLHDYQREGVRHIMENSHSALFLDMGLGKTVTTLTAISRLIFEELEIDRVLVIAPKRVAESVWDKEIKVWRHLSGLRISKITGSEQQRRRALQTPAEVYTIGRDNVAWLCGLFGGLSLPFDMLVIDEASSFKNPQAVRFKALRRVQPSFSRVVNLTGTPAPNGLIDLWAQTYLLDRGDRLGKTITEYRRNYFREGQKNGHIVYKYTIDKTNEQIIHERLKDICLSMKAADYLDMPKRVDNFIQVDLGDKVLAKYQEFERDQVLELLSSEEPITAQNAAALSNKLLQFANGAVYDAEGGFHEVHDAKLDALLSIIEEAAGKPVLVAYTYKHDLVRIMKALKAYKPVKLEKDADIDDWNAGKIQVMVMHPASGGHGLNLQQGGHIAVWFGQTWSLELYMQWNARLDRQGQEEQVFIHHLIAAGTIDSKVLAALTNKTRTQDGLMEAVKSLLAKYRKS